MYLKWFISAPDPEQLIEKKKRRKNKKDESASKKVRRETNSAERGGEPVQEEKREDSMTKIPIEHLSKVSKIIKCGAEKNKGTY